MRLPFYGFMMWLAPYYVWLCISEGIEGVKGGGHIENRLHSQGDHYIVTSGSSSGMGTASLDRKKQSRRIRPQCNSWVPLISSCLPHQCPTFHIKDPIICGFNGFYNLITHRILSLIIATSFLLLHKMKDSFSFITERFSLPSNQEFRIWAACSFS